MISVLTQGWFPTSTRCSPLRQQWTHIYRRTNTPHQTPKKKNKNHRIYIQAMDTTLSTTAFSFKSQCLRKKKFICLLSSDPTFFCIIFGGIKREMLLLFCFLGQSITTILYQITPLYTTLPSVTRFSALAILLFARQPYFSALGTHDVFSLVTFPALCFQSRSRIPKDVLSQRWILISWS